MQMMKMTNTSPVPPARFKPAGTLTHVSLCDRPKCIPKRRRHTASQKDGLKFEEAVLDSLHKSLSGVIVPGMWLGFRSKEYPGLRYAQPDGVYFEPRWGRITIIECKLRHTEKAWWQLRTLYEPLIRFVFPDWDVDVCEVFKYNNRDVRMPEPILYVQKVTAEVDRFKAHKWRV